MNPARSIQRSSSLPARPENGRRDSRSAGPGAWPTKRNFAPHSPEKVGVASVMIPWSAQTVHVLQAAWWAANAARGAEVKFPVTCHDDDGAHKRAGARRARADPG